jgi:hypothetical protein
MNSIRQKIESLLNQLPDDCSIEDIQYHLYVLEKVRQSLSDASLENTIPKKKLRVF